MAENPTSPISDRLSASDVTVDEAGRVVVDNATLAQALRSADLAGAARAKDTNIICCGNGNCADETQGSLFERMVRGRF